MLDEDVEAKKLKIVALFRVEVKGKRPDTIKANVKHSGKEGHWLEAAMGLKLNASNAPDFLGFEMKNHTSGKTTFGDWSASYYIFRDPEINITRDEFLQIFGKPNAQKNGRFSWSGEPIPKIDRFNKFGQKLEINYDDDVVITYSYSHDERPDKSSVVPESLQQDDLVLARWDAEWLSAKLESKFNQYGWFKCLKNKDGLYDEIVFGDPINFQNWIKLVKQGVVFFDSGMYQGNSRNYSQWRADNKLWASLVTSSYK